MTEPTDPPILLRAIEALRQNYRFAAQQRKYGRVGVDVMLQNGVPYTFEDRVSATHKIEGKSS